MGDDTVTERTDDEQKHNNHRSAERRMKFKRVEGYEKSGLPYLAPDLPPYFVSRAELLAIKKQLLPQSGASFSPITLHGPAGFGKTSIAAALAHDADVLEAFPDGVLWIALSDGNDVQHAQTLWGEALQTDLRLVPDTATRSAVLRSALEDKRVLLVVDDITEPEQVRALNVGGPHCARILITNSEQTAFAIKTRRYTIAGMGELEALSLLTEWSGLLSDVYLSTVKEIIKRLGGSPLALSLIGGQARQGITWLRLREVLSDDQGSIATLDTQDPGVQRRGLSLIVNLVLSRFSGRVYQQAALLGAFAAGPGSPFSRAAVAACWNVSIDDVKDTLDMFVDAALLTQYSSNLYTLHEALRDHLRRAANPSELQAATQRLQEHYLALVDGRTGKNERIDEEFGQIMAAMHATRDTKPAMFRTFGDALVNAYERRGLWANLVTLASETVDEANREGNVTREQMYLNDLGYALTILGRYEEAENRFKRSLEISQKLDDLAGQASALNNIGAVYERNGDLLEAERYYRQSLALREQLGIREDIAETLNNLAGVLYASEAYDSAVSAFQRVLDMREVLGERRGEAQTWLNIGAAYEAMGKELEAVQAYERSLAIYSNLNDQVGQAQAYNNLGIVNFSRGDVDRALAQFIQAQELKEQVGDASGQATTLNNIALLYENTGLARQALEYYRRSYEILDKMDDPRAEVVYENIKILQRRMGVD